MGFNWGGFAGGLSTGLNNGMRMGDSVNGMMKDYKVGQVRKQAAEEAKQVQMAEQAAKVKDNGAQGQAQNAAQDAPAAPVNTYQVDMGPAAGLPQQMAIQPPAPMEGMAGLPPRAGATSAPAPAMASIGIAPQQRFTVGAQGFDTKEAAQAAAAKTGPDLKTRQRDLVAERLEQHYIDSGDIESAEQWGKWRKNKANEVKMDTWAAGREKAKQGDFMGAAKDFIKLYGDYKDGSDVVSAKPFNDERGQPAGFEMVIKGPDGERIERIGAREIVAMGETGLNPQAIWQQDMAEQKAADAARVKFAADKARDTRKHAQALDLAGTREDREDRRTVAVEGAKNKRETGQAAQRKEEIRLRASLKQEKGQRDVREVGLAPHPQKIAMQVEKDLKDDRAKYAVAGGPPEGIRFDQMSEAQRDELVKRKVDKKLSTFSTPAKAAAPAGRQYQGAALWDGDDDEDDDD